MTAPQPSDKSSRANRRSASFQSIFTLILVLSILGFVNYIGSRHYSRQDWSKAQTNALSNKSKDVLSKLDAPLTITTMYSTLESSDFEQKKQIDRLLKEYQYHSKNLIKLENIDPATDAIQASELQKRLQFDANANLIILEYKKQVKFINVDDLVSVDPTTGTANGFKGEQVITSNLLSLIEGKIAKVYFTTGHLERDIADQSQKGVSWLSDFLKRDSIEIKSLNLTTQGDIPADADALVILGPHTSFSSFEVDAIDRFLNRNGQLVILIDPYVTTGLEPVLLKYGIIFDPDLILYRFPTPGGYATYPAAIISDPGISPNHELTAKFAGAGLTLKLLNMRSISIAKDDKGQPNPKVSPLLSAIDKSWGETKPLPSDEAMIPTFKDIVFDPKTDLSGTLNVAVAYDAGSPTNTQPGAEPANHGTRIVAIGGSQFLANAAPEPYAGDFFVNSIDWLVKKEPVLDISPKTPQEYPLSISFMQLVTLGAFALFVIPGIPLVLGLFTWISRLK